MAAPTVLGVSAVALNGSPPFTPSVTVQSGATAAYLIMGGWAGSGLDLLTGVLLDGNAPDAITSFEESGDAYSQWVLEWRSPSSGSQTLTLPFDEYTEELLGWVVSTSGGSLSGWTDVKRWESSGGGSFNLTTVVDALAVVLDIHYSGTPPGNESGWTSLGTNTINGSSARVRSRVATGASLSVAHQGTSFEAAIGFAIAPDAGGGGDGPVLTDVDTDETVLEGQTNVAVTGADLGATNANRTFTLEQGSVSVTQTETGTGTDTAATLTISIEESGTDIKFGAATLKVTRDDTETATISVTVNPPSGYAYVNIGTPATDPDERVSTDGDDLESGDQVWYETVTGLTIGTDGRISWAEGSTPAPFFCRVWDASDSTWGTGGTISPAGGDEQDGDLTAAGGFGATFAGRVAARAALTAGIGAATSSPGRADTAASVTVPTSVALIATALSQAAAALQAGLAAGEVWASQAQAAAGLAAAGEFGAAFAAQTAGAESVALEAGTSASASFAAALQAIAVITQSASIGMTIAAIAEVQAALAAGSSHTLATAAIVSAHAAVEAGATLGEAWAGHAARALALAAAGEFGATFQAATQASQVGSLSAGTAAAAQFAAAAQSLSALTATSSLGAAIEAFVDASASLSVEAIFGVAFATVGDDQILPPARATLAVTPRKRVLRIVPRVRSTRLH